MHRTPRWLRGFMLGASGSGSVILVVGITIITRMKTYLVRLKDKTELRVKAESYRREGTQYVFDGTASGEVEFVLFDLVASITVEPPRGPSRTRVTFS